MLQQSESLTSNSLNVNRQYFKAHFETSLNKTNQITDAVDPFKSSIYPQLTHYITYKRGHLSTDILQ